MKTKIKNKFNATPYSPWGSLSLSRLPRATAGNSIGPAGHSLENFVGHEKNNIHTIFHRHFGFLANTPDGVNEFPAVARACPERTRAQRHLAWAAAALLGLSLFSGCSFAPAYHKPAIETPVSYKEGADNVWKAAEPKDNILKGKWWEMFNDEELNGYEVQVKISNPTIAAAAANYAAARALAAEARSQFFPVIGVSPGATVSRTSKNASSNGSGGNSNTSYSLPFDASWEPDLWGRISNTVKAGRLEAQATQADLENTSLSVRASLASDYFQLRAMDAQKKLLDDAAAAYQKSLDLTKSRFQTGVASDQDVAGAETLFDTALAQSTDIGIARAQLEHAIAMLLGKAPANFSIAVKILEMSPPAIPAGAPSALLERRPDIAAAERRAAEANANIGVARSAFFPALTLGATAGVQSMSVASLISSPSRMWSLGATASQTLFNGGLYAAASDQAKAAYDGAVANYRQTALGAFQEVEDNLAALRLLSRERQEQDAAVKASERFLTLEQQRYEMGIDSYLNVIAAQTALIGNERTALNLRMEQLTASVQLIKALGGGWNQ
jgi:NodT family efflux transporter outer membrane factor (OMF) lipoprotein